MPTTKITTEKHPSIPARDVIIRRSLQSLAASHASLSWAAGMCLSLGPVLGAALCGAQWWWGTGAKPWLDRLVDSLVEIGILDSKTDSNISSASGCIWQMWISSIVRTLQDYEGAFQKRLQEAKHGEANYFFFICNMHETH